MYAIDTEVTGLHFQHGVTTFAIGAYNGSTYQAKVLPINPITRRRSRELSSKAKQTIRSFYDTDVVFQNANFDIKAQCELGIFNWQEPCSKDFWKHIHELGHLVHLYDSTKADFGAGLKALTKEYLGVPYTSDKELLALVNRCRTFIKNRLSTWKIANEVNTPSVVDKFNKADMWLPAAVLEHYPDDAELRKYFKKDYPKLGSVLQPYLKDDCKNTFDLAAGFIQELSNRHPNLDDLLSMNRDILHVVYKMELNGTSVRKAEMDNAINVCDEWISKTHRSCQELTQTEYPAFTDEILRELLFDPDGYALTPVKLTKGGKDGLSKKPSVDAKSLLKLKDQCVELGLTEADKFMSQLLAHRKYDKKRQALLRYRRTSQAAVNTPWLEDSEDTFVFPWFKSTGTSTTRFSSDFQNIEKANDPFADEYPDVAEMLSKSPMVRSVFGPREGYRWFAFDYSQLQLRIFAAATKDKALIQAFADGWDFHDFMTHVIFDLPPDAVPTAAQRRIGKNVNFGFIFGASEKKIDQTAGKSGLYGYLMETFPGAHEFIRSTKEKIKETGVVHTLGGYPLSIPIRTSPWGTRSYAAHMGVNYIVQGTEGEIVKKAMVYTDDYLNNNVPGARLLLQIHDEIVFEAPVSAKKYHQRNIKGLMQKAGAFYNVVTPVDGDIIPRRLDKKVELVL